MTALEALPVDLEILLDAVRVGVNQGFDAMVEPSSSPMQTDDEKRVLELANHHNLTPWLWGYIKARGFGSVALRHKTAAMMREFTIKNQLHTRECVALCAALKRENVAHILFKGLSIQARCYTGFVDQRYADDIDLLIAPKSFLAALNVLSDCGYAPRKPLDVSRLAGLLSLNPDWYRWRDVGLQKGTQGREQVDLHWRIYEDFAFPVSTSLLLEQAESMTVNDVEIPCLPFAMLFVHLCVHAHADHFFRLRQVVDIYCATQQTEFDWKEIKQCAEKWGVMHTVEDSMAVLNALFHGCGWHSPYVQTVVQHYVKSNGFTRRIHPNRRHWTLIDKYKHLYRQTKHRSRHRPWWAPLIARFKYNQAMLQHWSLNRSPALWYPVVLVKRMMARVTKVVGK